MMFPIHRSINIFFTMRKINELSFLNFRIIQSKHGISFDKSNNIKQKILNE